jgi:hypothetical protein
MALNKLQYEAKALQEYDHSFVMAYDLVEDGKEQSLNDISIFIKKHKKGYSSINLLKSVLLYIPVSAFIDGWLNTIKNKETRSKYRRAINRVFSIRPMSDLLKKNCAITTLDKNWSGACGVYKRIEILDATQSIITVCQTVYSKFCDFIRVITMGIVDPEETPKQKVDYYAAKIVCREINHKSFISNLTEPFNLIAEMVFLAAETCEYRLRVVDPRRNVLALETSQINHASKSISFKFEQSYHVIGAHIRFPEEFMGRLTKYTEKREGLVFLTQKNKQIYPSQVERSFKKASKHFPYEITPTILGWMGVVTHQEKRKAEINDEFDNAR